MIQKSAIDICVKTGCPGLVSELASRFKLECPGLIYSYEYLWELPPCPCGRQKRGFFYQCPLEFTELLYRVHVTWPDSGSVPANIYIYIWYTEMDTSSKEMFVFGCIGNSHCDHFQCSQLRKLCQTHDISISLYVCLSQVTPFPWDGFRW